MDKAQVANNAVAPAKSAARVMNAVQQELVASTIIVSCVEKRDRTAALGNFATAMVLGVSMGLAFTAAVRVKLVAPTRPANHRISPADQEIPANFVEAVEKSAAPTTLAPQRTQTA